MDNKVKTIEQWVLESEGLIFRYQVYRRIYTPYEQKNASVYDSCFESPNYHCGYIEKVIPLGDGEWLIGFRDIYDIYDGVNSGAVQFYRLSEIRLEIWDADQEEEDE